MSGLVVIINMLVIPDGIKPKPIAKGRLDPLSRLASKHKLLTIGDLTHEVMRSCYAEDEGLFWKLVDQLSFLGVIFTGNLVRFSVSNELEPLLISVSAYRQDEVIDYLGMGLAPVRQQLLSYGILYKADLDRLPVSSLRRIVSELSPFWSKANSEGIGVPNNNQVSYPSASRLCKRYVRINGPSVQETGALCFNSLELTVPENCFGLGIEGIQNCPNVIRQLLKLGLTTVGQLPGNLSELRKLYGVGPKVVEKFMSKVSKLIESDQVDTSADASVESGIVLADGKVIGLAPGIQRVELSSDLFSSKCELIVEILQERGISYLGELPQNLESYLLSISGVGRLKVAQFLDDLRSLAARYSTGRPSLQYIDELPADVRNMPVYVSDLTPHGTVLADFALGEGIQALGELCDSVTLFANGSDKTQYALITELSGFIYAVEDRLKRGLQPLSVWSHTFWLSAEETSVTPSFRLLPRSYQLLKGYIGDLRSLKAVESWALSAPFCSELIADLKVLSDRNELVPVLSAMTDALDAGTNDNPPLGLTCVQWRILRGRFTLGQDGAIPTYRALGKKHDLTYARVGQIISKSCRKLLSKHSDAFLRLRSHLSLCGGIARANDLLRKPLKRTTHLIFLALCKSYGLEVDEGGGYIGSLGDSGFQQLLANIGQFIRQNMSFHLITEPGLNEIIASFVSENGLDYDVSILQEITIDTLLTHCAGGYRLSAVSKGELIREVFRLNFPDGLHVYKDAARLKERLAELYPAEFQDETERNIAAHLLRSPEEVLLWGWGFYLPRESVTVEPDDLRAVVCWLSAAFESGLRQVPVAKPFEAFQERLQSTGVANELALYSCLRLFYPRDFSYPRAPWVLPREAGMRITNADALKSFMLETRRRVSKQELQAEFVGKRGWRESQLTQAINNSQDIVSAGRSNYVHVDMTGVEPTSLEPIVQFVNSRLETESSISVRGAFSAKIATCHRLGIDNDVLLYSLLAYHFGNLFGVGRYPLIVSKSVDSMEEISCRALVEDFALTLGTTVFRTELKQRFIDELGWAQRTLDGAVANSQLIVPVNNAQEYVHRRLLGLTQANLDEVEGILLSDLASKNSNEQYVSLGHLLRTTVTERLPQIKVASWTEDVLRFFVQEMPSLIALGTKRLVIVEAGNEFGVADEIDFIAHVVRVKYGGAVKITELEDHLREVDFISKAIPSSFLGGEEADAIPFVVTSDEIILKELFANA